MAESEKISIPRRFGIRRYADQGAGLAQQELGLPGVHQDPTAADPGYNRLARFVANLGAKRDYNLRPPPVKEVSPIEKIPLVSSPTRPEIAAKEMTGTIPGVPSLPSVGSVRRETGPPSILAGTSSDNPRDLARNVPSETLNWDAFSPENIAKARAQAQRDEKNGTGVNFGVNEETMNALRGLGETRRRAAFQRAGEPYIPEGQRRESGTMEGTIQAPTARQAIQDYLGGKAGSRGYGMVRNALIDIEPVGESRKSRAGRGGKSGNGLIETLAALGEEPAQAGPDLGDQISFANLQRNLAKDTRQAAQADRSFALNVRGQGIREQENATRTRENLVKNALAQVEPTSSLVSDTFPSLANMAPALAQEAANQGVTGGAVVGGIDRVLRQMASGTPAEIEAAQALTAGTPLGTELFKTDLDPSDIDPENMAHFRAILQKKLAELSL